MLKDCGHVEGLTVTINTTEDCNMRCKYCYEINKRKVSIDFDKCKKFIDLLLSDENYLDFGEGEFTKDLWKKGLIIDFIGGDALMNVDICDKTLTYLVYKLNTTKSKRADYWRDSWRCSISSNGTLLGDPKVRAFLEKWQENISLGISIDGCPEIHDKNRIMAYRGKNGEEVGSMDIIMSNWDWYKEHFPYNAVSTKATCARDTIPYLYESLVFMHETLGMKYINQNFIMEDTGCTEEDYKILREQMQKCIDYVYDHRDELFWSMIDQQFLCRGITSSKEDYNKRGRCGSGCMPALSIDGRIYPCFRWLPHTQKEAGVMCVGDVEHGFNHSENFRKVREGSIRANCTKDPECQNCEYEPACTYCIGGCYAEYGDFVRTKHICEIIKIQVEYARKYWARLGVYEYELDNIPHRGYNIGKEEKV